MTDVPSNLIPTRITQLPVAPVADENSLMMIVYQGNNYQIRVGDLLAVAGVPVTRQVIAGTGMTGGGQLTTNVTLSIANGGVGTTQLATTGVTPNVYGSATAIPVFTVDATGRVTAATTVAPTISGYVPVSRQVIAGTGLSGGGPLSSNVTLTANLSNAAPLAGFQTGSAGTSTDMARADHKHPAVNVGVDDEVDGVLGLGNGGTARSIVAAAGAVIWSGADGLYVGPVGIAGQVLVSGGTGAPTWGSALIVSNQVANIVYAGPASGPAAPTGFRSLVTADLPNSGATAATYGSQTAVPVIAVNAKGQITSATNTTINAVTLTTGTISTAPTNGTDIVNKTYADSVVVTYSAGTGLTLASNTFSITNTAVAAAAYGSASSVATFTVNGQGQLTLAASTPIAIAATQVTSGTFASALISGSYTGITGVGTLTVGTWNATAVGAAYGGTGLTSYAVGDLVYASGATTLASLADVATGNALISGGVGVAPSYGKIGLTTHVSGTLPVANGGTNLTSYTVGDLVYASGATTLASLADVATGNALISGGVGAAPSYGKIGLTTHVSGTLPVANGGTNGTATPTAGAVPYGSGTAYAFSAAGTTNQVLLSGGTGSPTWSNQSALAVGTATNIAGGVASQIPYQTGAGATSFIANGTAGQVLVSAGASAPAWAGIDGGTF
jgi:hypothetical protein